MIAIFDRDNSKQRDDARQQLLDKLPDGVRRWVLELERDAQKQVASVRKQTAQLLRPLEMQAAAVQSIIDNLQATLDVSQAWLSAIPAEAEPSEAQRHLAVKTLWPDRIQKARDELASVRQQIDSVRRSENKQMDEQRVRLQAQLAEVANLLPHLRLNAYGD